jgi:hypothetical protein
MYKYAMTLSVDQLASISIVEGSESTVIINSITYDPQVIGISIITIPPVDPKYITKYPACKNFIKDKPIVIKVLHTQPHEVSVVSILNSSFYLVTNVTTSHIPRISELPDIIKGALSPTKPNAPDLIAAKSVDGVMYVPGEGNNAIIAAPPTEFSMRSYWLATKDGLLHTESQCDITSLSSKYCDTNGNIVPSTVSELIVGNLAKSHLMFKNTTDVFSVTSTWPTPPSNTVAVNGLRVEYNSVSNPDFLTLFIKKDWREF